MVHLWRSLIEHITLATAFVTERNKSDEWAACSKGLLLVPGLARFAPRKDVEAIAPEGGAENCGVDGGLVVGACGLGTALKRKEWYEFDTEFWLQVQHA